MVDVIYIKSPEPITTIIPNSDQSDTLCKQFSNWLLISRPGEKICYYFGDYVAGKAVGRLAFKAYENGSIILFQKKEGHKCGYWAQKKRRWE